MGSIAPEILEDQSLNNKNLKWVHSISAGIDGYVAKKAFKESPVPLTNSKGAYSDILGEFIALGVLYHSKYLERFLTRKKERKWEPEPMELVSSKHMAIVGYGDIGSSCAKIVKNGFGMQVTGIKRDPSTVPDHQRSYCDEIVGNDQYERVIKEADFVVGVLPKVVGVTDDFFNMESTFRMMKSSAVFMNIGRGSTVDEDDLIKALNEKIIAGAVLDVFKTEPLPQSSGLWDCDNLIITPHCADQDKAHLNRAMKILGTNIENWISGGKDKLVNVCDKEKGY